MKKFLFLSLFVAVAGFFATTTNAQAFEVTAESITSSDDSAYDVHEIPSQPPDPNIVEDTLGVGYGAPGVTYTGVFTLTGTEEEVALAPMVLVSGGKIQSYSWDATAHQMTIVWVGDQFVIPGQTELSNESAFAFIKPGADHSPANPQTVGPPASMAGGYISTNIMDWRINPPSSPEETGFGLTLNGPSGFEGYFTMKMPSRMLSLMSLMSGKAITADDLAVFIDGYQSSVNKTVAPDGGVIFDIGVTFTANNTQTSAVAAFNGSAKTVSKTVMAQRMKKLSAAFKKGKVKKDKLAKLYGWFKNAKKNRKLMVYAKRKGEKKYEFVEEIKVKNNKGLYRYAFEPEEEGTYFYQIRSKNGKVKSQGVRLKVI
jgi:hypothetical protein